MDTYNGNKLLRALCAMLCAAGILFVGFARDIASGDIASGEFVTVGVMVNKGGITLDAPRCVDIPVIIGGVFAEGAGYDVYLTVLDDESGAVYAEIRTTTKNRGAFSFLAELPSVSYDRALTAYLLGEGKTEQSYVKFTFSGGIAKNKAIVDSAVSQIEALIAECEVKNISVEYEKVNLAIIKKFNGFLDGYFTKELITEYLHNLNAIVSISQETTSALAGYLDGSRAEKVAPRYLSSRVKIDGQSLIAQMETKGVVKEQPIFLNGYGHWADALNDFDSFSDMGVNYTQYEIGPASILKAPSSGSSFEVNEAAVQKVKTVFESAERNNVSVVFLAAVHYFPDFIYAAYPEIDNNGKKASFPNSVPYNPTHPKVKEAIEVFLRAVVSEIKDYKSFQSICLANEPLFLVNEYPDYYLADYQQFLEQKYGTISALNKAYGGTYLAFNRIGMPTRVSATARYNDYREFNDSILTQWFAWMSGVIKDIDSDIPVHIKCSSYISSGNTRRRAFCGTNYEQWSQFMNQNGCDAWAIYGNASSMLQGKTMWYDFMTSLKNAPVINSEDHILSESDDGQITYNPDELQMNMADVWQGAIHGRAGAVYWIWDKSARTADGTWYYNSNLSRRADHVAGISKLSLDLNRLASEVTAIQKKPARTAILYSNYSQVAMSYHTAAMYEVYRRLVNDGEKVFVANDTYPQMINENENLEILIVPTCAYMPTKVWQEIKKFQDKGKRVIFAELGNTYYTEIGASVDGALKEAVLSAATRVSFGGLQGDYTMVGLENIYAAIDDEVNRLADEVSVTDPRGETEWTAVGYKGGYVVNLLILNWYSIFLAFCLKL
ncbi:hypothetical protein FACS189492_2110 [Clostridia bacterium]|nr:hypothetical protein FACS189492_2110 [Clostridia bacterium]